MYRALETRVLAEEAEKKEKAKALRVSQGLPAEDGEHESFRALAD